MIHVVETALCDTASCNLIVYTTRLLFSANLVVLLFLSITVSCSVIHCSIITDAFFFYSLPENHTNSINNSSINIINNTSKTFKTSRTFWTDKVFYMCVKYETVIYKFVLIQLILEEFSLRIYLFPTISVGFLCVKLFNSFSSFLLLRSVSYWLIRHRF